MTNGGRSLHKNQLLTSNTQVAETITLIKPSQLKNKIFLQQKYIEEGLSMSQIANIIPCSRIAVRSALVKANIPIRGIGNTYKNHQQLPYGKRRKNGEIIDHKAEQAILNAITRMKTKEGLSNNAIAKILTEMKVPTKQKGKKWHAETIRLILKRVLNNQ